MLKPDYYTVNLSQRLLPPSFSHPFGTDYLGRDLVSRICLGGLISFSISLIAVSISLLVGFLVAFFAAVIIALSVSGWVGFARLSRGLIISKLNEDYFVYSIASGEKVLKAVVKHIIPNIKTPLLVQLLLSFAGAVIVEASLSFLGIGIKPPLPSWGNIIADGKEFILVAPYISVIPGIFLTLSVLCIKNFLKID